MANESDLKLIKSDFRNFLYLVWKHLGLPSPTPMQFDIADYLQHGPRRKIIQAMRGEGKSWITSAYVDWCLLNDPQERFLIISASKERSDSFSIFTKRLINEIPILHHLRARNDQRDSNIAFDVGPSNAAHAPSVKSVGITGQITGSRATKIIADDVEVERNALTQVQREKLKETVKEFDSVIVPGGQITYLGTPQCLDTLYNELTNRGYSKRLWPAKFPTQEELVTYKGFLSPYILDQLDQVQPGDPTDPLRFDSVELAERQLSLGKSTFDLQFMLNTSASDELRFPLKLRDLIVMPLNTEVAPGIVQWCNDSDHMLKEIDSIGFGGDFFYKPMYISDDKYPYQGAVMHIDPAGRGKDQTGYCVTKLLNSMVFVLELGGLDGGYDEDTLMILSKIAKKHNVNEVQSESNFGDGMFNRLLSPVLHKFHPCSLTEIKHNTQKEVRIIDTLEPLMNSHRLIVDYDVIVKDSKGAVDKPYQSLSYQMTRLTRDRGALIHDDKLDALAMAGNYWTIYINGSVKQQYDKRNEEFLKSTLADFGKLAQSTLNYANIGKKRLKSKPKWVTL
jgi:hypothetical protein